MKSRELTLKKWGNSQGIRINKEILDALDINFNEENPTVFQLTTENTPLGKKIILEPVKEVSPLKQLFIEFEEKYSPENTKYNWGEIDTPVGKELV